VLVALQAYWCEDLLTPGVLAMLAVAGVFTFLVLEMVRCADDSATLDM
jgi:hypothetical protein